MEHDEIMEIIESDKREKVEYKKDNTNDLWSRTNIEPIKLDPGDLTTDKFSFLFILPHREDSISDSTKEAIFNTMKKISEKNIELRIMCSSNDKLLNKLSNLFLRSAFYLPWKKYNENIKDAGDAILPDEYSYGVALSYNSKFNNLSPAVRAIISTNVKSVLGKDNKTKPLFILTITDCGTETLGKKMDFKTIGNLFLFLKLSQDLSIPFFNIKNENFNVDKIINLIG